MLDTNICSFIMREQPESVLKRLEQAVMRRNRIVVSAITYAEMQFGAIGKKASPRHGQLVQAFCFRLQKFGLRSRSWMDLQEVAIHLLDRVCPLILVH